MTLINYDFIITQQWINCTIIIRNHIVVCLIAKKEFLIEGIRDLNTDIQFPRIRH